MLQKIPPHPHIVEYIDAFRSTGSGRIHMVLRLEGNSLHEVRYPAALRPVRLQLYLRPIKHDSWLAGLLRSNLSALQEAIMACSLSGCGRCHQQGMQTGVMTEPFPCVWLFRRQTAIRGTFSQQL